MVDLTNCTKKQNKTKTSGHSVKCIHTGMKVSLRFCLQILQQSSEGGTIVPTLGMRILKDLPGIPVVKTLPFHCRGKGAVPGQGTKTRMLHGTAKKQFTIIIIIIIIIFLKR